MRLARAILATATIVVTACATDGTSSPTTNDPSFETRLAAAATAPTTSIGGPTLTINVAVTNTLPETVSGGVCVNSVMARAVNRSTWTDVTSSLGVCSALAVILAPGNTVSFRGIADPAKVRAVIGGNTGIVVFKVQHSLSGASTNYLLQSNEVSWTVN
jgi:hypothetical protein